MYDEKFFTTLILLASFVSSVQSAKAISFNDALNDSKPTAVMIYAPWADNLNTTQQAFNNIGARYANTYNFVTINIANEEAKAFNQRFYIYPNLPYVLLFRSSGKVSRFLKQDCVVDEACFAERLDMFNN